MKKLFAAFLAIILLTVMLPITAVAAETTVSTEAELSAAVAAGGNIKLANDITLTNRIDIQDGQSVTIDLNGFSIKKGSLPFYLRHGTLTFTGTGSVEETELNQYSPVLVKGSQDQSATNYSVLNVGANVTFTGWAPIFIDQNNGAAYGVVVNFNGKANGNYEDSAGAYINGTIQDKVNCPQINIGSTAVVEGKTMGIYAAGYAIWNIQGTVVGSTGIYMKAGEVNASGATITATGAAAAPQPNGNGADSTGDAIIMDSKVGYAGDMKLNLGAGNQITSANGYALQVANTDVSSGTNVVELKISGGNFSGSSESVKLSDEFVTAAEGDNVTVSVTGGTFGGEASQEVIGNYVPSNMDVNEDGTVVSKTITIIVPSESGTTTPAEETKNPSTGANDFVGAAVAVMVISAVGIAALSRKK